MHLQSLLLVLVYSDSSHCCEMAASRHVHLNGVQVGADGRLQQGWRGAGEPFLALSRLRRLVFRCLAVEEGLAPPSLLEREARP